MKGFKSLLYPGLIVVALIVLLVILRNKALNLKAQLDNLHYETEVKSVLAEKYFSTLKLLLLHQNEKIKEDILVYEDDNNTSFFLYDIIKTDDLVLCIPEFSCQECIDTAIKHLKNFTDQYHKVIVLSVFYDKKELENFFIIHDIPCDKWKVFNIKTEYFWDLSKNKLFLFKVNIENKLQKFVILDGDFDELLEIFLMNDL